MSVRLASPIAAAIAAGATIVTPNNRLARRLVQLHDDAQRAAGLRAWASPSVLPWLTWLHTLRTDAPGADGHVPSRVLSRAQSSHLWRRIVGADTAASAPLVDARGAATLAQQAWTMIHAYGAGGESWRGFATQGDDEAAFVRWAERYATALERLDAVDDARLPDRLAAGASTLGVRGRDVVLAGFLDVDPQQRRLIDALAAAGARIRHVDPLPAAAAMIGRVCARSARDELVCALEWARDRSASNPSATIGIAVDDLAGRRDEAIALADDVLCAPSQWPGDETLARPYNVSLGVALADVPLVACALDLIGVAHAPISLANAATLVRSPYLAGATSNWPARAAIERRWLDDGRRSVDRVALASALASDPVLAPRWQSPRAPVVPTRRASARALVDSWRAWLAHAGWPGDRTLVSAEFQARDAFDELLASFVSLAALGDDMSAAQAVDALRALAGDTLWQPQAPRAPVQIVGWLEAAGLPLDALWIAGMSSQRWPRAPRPHPLLPLAWQRERNVPHASAQRELDDATALTAQLARGATVIVASYAKSVDDHACAPSPLIAHWQDGGEVVAHARTMRHQFDARPAFERVAADRAPPLVRDAEVKGGAGVVEAQSECPFRASAKYRLRVEPWDAAPIGLAAWERGRLVHAALAAFWRGVRTHATLIALSHAERDRRIDAAVAEAMTATLKPPRMHELPPIVRATEPDRLAALVRDWLDRCDRPRAPFTVRDVERESELSIGGVRLRVRMDRVDALADGGAAIVDYKSGETVPLRRWFDERPSATQLGVYALAWRDAERATPLRAAAFGAVTPEGAKAIGIADDARTWPGLAVASALGDNAPRDWPSLLAWWHERMSKLAEQFAAGDADVDPRDREVCPRCGLQALCRVDAEAPTDGDVDD